MKKIVSVHKFVFVVFCCLITKAYSQSHTNIHLALSERVKADSATNKELKSIIRLWENYLNSRPDSSYDNPFWNYREKSMYKEFDFTQDIYKGTISFFYKYKPIVLSIEKDNENYFIRTLFGWPVSADSSMTILAINRVYAIKENKEWKLANALSFLTTDYNMEKIGNIKYIYPPEKKLDYEQAYKAERFCDSIAALFHLKKQDILEYYMNKDADEAFRIRGFDYHYSPVGLYQGKNNILWDTYNSEFYSHEIVHYLFREFSAHYIINEGIATWLGGSHNKKLDDLVVDLNERLLSGKELSVPIILENKHRQYTPELYVLGGVLCKAIFDRNGVNGVKQLLMLPKSLNKEKLLDEIAKILLVDKKNLDVFIRNEISADAASFLKEKDKK